MAHKALLVAALLAPFAATVTHAGSLQQRMDRLGDLTMEKQQRLQMYMQPFTQASSMISNIARKSAKANSNIIKNMK